MKVYSGFGSFNATSKIAVLEICLPELVNPTAEKYLYQYKNVSTSAYNGLVVFVKKTNDNGAGLSGFTLNHERVTINLDTVTEHSGTTGNASEFVYSKNFILIVHHEANTGEYNAVAKQLFDNLNTIATTGTILLNSSSVAAGPKKTGTGAIVKI